MADSPQNAGSPSSATQDHLPSSGKAPLAGRSQPGNKTSLEESLIEEAVTDMKMGTEVMRQATRETAADAADAIKAKAQETVEWVRQMSAEAGEIMGSAWEAAKEKSAAASAAAAETVRDARATVAEFIAPE
ncbi:uncharacterized protein LOC34620168 [Cyclospora cayetanensis]|uniref:Uncharacterized protein LOC34620168 n=2 Tax=Cyclospora cayetanensis TaxID=88456 RepID=A0A6P5WEG1_9EIME|nr:uncharacterized protein LOC34620168 [Cyclospora cayetanensis]OEH80649.1 hypothetical protein cyc_03485 [Cyclospora cayetanensis]